jgi:organic hydroperoxide reductase OsmC/OhrA
MTQSSAVAASATRSKVMPLPHHYEVAVRSEGPGRGVLESGVRPAIAAGLPPEFGGDGERWSPEHLLLSAVSLCLMNTFQVFAERRGLPVSTYSSVVKGILDKTPAGPVFTSIVVVVELGVSPEKQDEARSVLEDAKHHCIAANALKTPVDVRIVTPAA